MANTLKFGNGEWYGKEDTILAYNDENKNFKPLPFDFERGSVATRINKEGLIETVGANEPRVDYKDDSKGSLLLEPSRTNLVSYSEDFTTGWSNLISGSGINPVITSNQGTSPDGSLNADKVVFDLNGGVSSSDYSLLDYSLSGFSNPHTLDTSIYLKSSDGNDYQVAIYNRGTSVQIITVTSQWQRFSVNGTRSNTTNNFRIGLFGDNSSNTASLLLFAAQAEQGSYATSYIPTQGTVQTRLADSCSQTVPDGVIGQTEGVLYFEGVIYGENSSVNRRIFTISNGTSTTAINIQTPASNSKIEFEVTNGGSTQVFIASANNSLVYGEKFKLAFAYKLNDFVAYMNGNQIGIDTNGTVPLCDNISFDRGNGTSKFEGSSSQAQLYNTRLSNSELQALTQV